MTALIKGKVTSEWLEQEIDEGEFVRDESIFRHWVTSDGSAGPTGNSGFKAEANRYHLYISHACPWAHRTVIFRKLKQLEGIIGLSVVEPEMLDLGWRFSNHDHQYQDPINDVEFVHQLYTLADPEITSQVTVPILWDKQQQTIVNNESSEIIRMFNYLKELYQVPSIADTVHFDYIKRHYYYSHETVNPTRIVPKGPEYNLSTAHNRENISI